jgi:phosphonate transport system ATP-binding protein
LAPAIEVDNLHKTYGTTKALDGMSLTVEEGEMVALIGASGSGKSTLLRHLSGLVVGDEGSGNMRVLGQTVQRNGDLNSRLRRIRADIGFIFQQFNLVGRLPLLTNVLTGLLSRTPMYRSLIRCFTREEKRHAMEALDRVGIARNATQLASTLSGGQQQRGAIARALVQKAKIILADEPIASLDPGSSRTVMDTLRRINQEDGVTVLVSLHQVDYAMRYCPRSVGLTDGRVVFDGPSSGLDTSLLRGLYGEEFAYVEEEVDRMVDEPVEPVAEDHRDRLQKAEALSEV